MRSCFLHQWSHIHDFKKKYIHVHTCIQYSCCGSLHFKFRMFYMPQFINFIILSPWHVQVWYRNVKIIQQIHIWHKYQIHYFRYTTDYTFNNINEACSLCTFGELCDFSCTIYFFTIYTQNSLVTDNADEHSAEIPVMNICPDSGSPILHWYVWLFTTNIFTYLHSPCSSS